MFDLMLAAYLTNPDERNEYNILTKRILNIDLYSDEKNYDQNDVYLSNVVVLNFKLQEELTKILN